MGGVGAKREMGAKRGVGAGIEVATSLLVTVLVLVCFSPLSLFRSFSERSRSVGKRGEREGEVYMEGGVGGERGVDIVWGGGVHT